MKSYSTGVRCYRELGEELERHGESLSALIRLALDSLLADLPNLRDLYHDHPLRTDPIPRKKLERMERELADRMAMLRAQRAARFLARFKGNIPSTTELNLRRTHRLAQCQTDLR